MDIKKLPMCRICLVQNVNMYEFANTCLQEIYEKLTDAPLMTEDNRPTLSCFICHDKLKQCHQLQRQCRESEERFAQMLNEDCETKPRIIQDLLEFSENAVTPTQHNSVSADCHTESAVIKEEPPADCGGQEGEQQTDSISPHCSESGDTPPRPSKLGDEGDSEDDLPLMEFKIEVEEEKVYQEKRQPEETKKLEMENVENSYPDVKDTPAHHSVSESEGEHIMEIKTEVEYEQESIGAPAAKKPKLGTRRTKLEDTITAELKNTKHVVKNSFNNTALVINCRKNSNKDDIRDIISNKAEKHLNNCYICQRSFTKRSHLIRHFRVHPGQKPFKCHICQQTFTQKWTLTSHIRVHTGEKPFKCSICRQTFSGKSNLRSHIRVHTGENSFKCDVCPLSYKTRNSLINHVRVHTGEKPFKCDICPLSFSRKVHLTSHVSVHIGEKPFKCDICSRSFLEKRGLKIHVRVHTGEKPFTCDICQRSFSHKSSLPKHIRTHTGEKPFKCDLCESRFNDKGYLRTHMRFHTGEKPFKCNLCQHSFSDRNNLKGHIRVHTGEKASKCDVCQLSFSDLTRHVRTHTKPFKCDICQLGFRAKSVLIRHTRSQHACENV